MTITHERQPHIAGWEAHWRGDPCAGERPHGGVWNFHRKYAGCSSIAKLPGAFALGNFLRIYYLIFLTMFWDSITKPCHLTLLALRAFFPPTTHPAKASITEIGLYSIPAAVFNIVLPVDLK